MGKSWIPLRDQQMRAFVSAFLATITPSPSTYGLVLGDVTLLTTQVDDFIAKLATSDEPSTRTSVTIAAKDMSRRTLLGTMRNLYKKVLAANLTNDKLEALGLQPRNAPSPIPAPSMRPVITIVSRDENTVKLKFTDPTDPTRRGRPPGVDGIAVFKFVGPNAPTNEEDWEFEGNSTVTTVSVGFPTNVAPGTKVWFTAFYFNPRARSGPAATPVSTNIPGGAAMAQAA